MAVVKQEGVGDVIGIIFYSGFQYCILEVIYGMCLGYYEL